MQLFNEAGVFAVVCLVLFVVALVRVHLASSSSRASTGATWSALLCAVAVAGAGLSQRLVDAAVAQAPTALQKVELLSLGTREAHANLLLGGIMACAVAVWAGARQRLTDDAAGQ